MDHPERKATRIPGYDYATPNYYFVTICTHEKECLFGSVEHLNGYGQITQELLLEIPKHYSNVSIDKYVIMPNHIHAIIVLREQSEKSSKSLPIIMAQYKSAVSKAIGKLGNTLTRIPCAGISTAVYPFRIRRTVSDTQT